MNLVVMALKEESQGLFEEANIPVLFTGVGKINAAYFLSKKVHEMNQKNLKITRVLNFGTAGSQKFKTGTLVEVSKCLQRDMDLSLVGLKPGVTPFDKSPSTLQLPKVFQNIPDAICGTGDCVEYENTSGLIYDVLDMEAFSLAKVCFFEKIPFTSVKYVTDQSNENTLKDWTSEIKNAAKSFINLYKEYDRVLS